MKNSKIVAVVFSCLVCLSLLAPLWVFKDLLFPYVTSKAFYFRICIELALPFYLYLLVMRADLRPKWKGNWLNWLMLVFLLINLVSALAGDEVTRSLWGNFERMGGVYYLGHLTLLYFYVLMIGQMGGNYLKRFLQLFLAMSLVITVNGFFGKLGWPVLVMDPSLPGRVSSTLGNPIYLGSFLVVPLFVAAFLGSQAEQQWKKWTYYLFSFLFFIGILLSGTRGATVGLILGVFFSTIVYLALTSNRKLKIYGLGVVCFFVVLFGLLYAFSNHLPQGSDFQRLFKLDDSNTKARLIQWGTALKGYKDHPWLGVGPENYYAIANKYYNPAIYQYDRSWFDKPHNYIIEILVTDGIFGLLAYLGILAFIIAALYKGYKTGFLTLFEFCALLACLLAYQIQNMTVFDTVPASLAFYVFMGLCGFVFAVSGENPKQQKTSDKKNNLNSNQSFALATAGVSVVVIAYLIYATNIVPMEIAKAVNYGSAYGAVDPATDNAYLQDISTADSYFQRALNLPFNFDKTETAAKYSDFVTGFSRSATAADLAEENKVNAEAVNAINDALAIQPDYPILWEDLAQVNLFKGVQNGQMVSVDPEAVVDINKAIALAPKREEGYLILAQIVGAEGEFAQAQSILQNIIEQFPTDTNAKAQLALIYRIQNKNDLAANIIEQAEAQGYTFSSYADMQWLVSYYFNSKQYTKALALLQQDQSLEPDNLDMLANLAEVYAATGQKDQAISIAEQVMKADPTRQQAMQELINLLTQNPAPAH